MTPRILAAALLAALTLTTSAYAGAGSTDPNFGTSGVLRMETAGLQSETGVALQADGRLIVTGAGANDGFARVRRLNGNGTPDGDFGDGGVKAIDGPGITDRINAVLVQPDGKILLGGSSGNS